MGVTNLIPGWVSLEQLLKRHALRDPERSAIVDVDSGERISFGELARVVDGVALQLQEHGAGPGIRVVLLTDGGIETVLIWLALWRLAAVVCPFELSQLGARSTEAAIRTLNPALILHGQGICASDIKNEIASCVQFGQWPPVSSEISAVRMTPLRDKFALRSIGAQPNDFAAACCTSGSSGRIKIVMHDHASYWLNGCTSQELLSLVEKDCLLDYRALSWYSMQILSLMPLLQIGLTLHIARHFSATRFPDWIAQHRITVVAGVPTVLNILLQNSMVRLKDCASKVRLMTSSSAPLATHTWERFERESGIPVINLYGTSETGWICGNRLNERRMGTVGLVVSGVKLDIVNANRSSCKTGELGELVIESTKIALGTLQEDGSLLQIRNQPFFTRDLASRDENGFVRLIGRMDDLVIRGGVKISPGEIEDAILTHPDVCEAVVLCVPDKIYGQEAICFVVLRSTTTVDSNALVMHLKNSLPREKLPKSILAIDSIPRNIRGKVHLDALTAHWRAATQA